MSLRHPKPVFQDPELGFVGFGAASRWVGRRGDPSEAASLLPSPLTTSLSLPAARFRRAAPDLWRHGPQQDGYATYSLHDGDGAHSSHDAHQQQGAGAA